MHGTRCIRTHKYHLPRHLARHQLSIHIPPCLSIEILDQRNRHSLHPQQNLPTRNSLPRQARIHDPCLLQILHQIEYQAIAAFGSEDIDGDGQKLSVQGDG